MAKKAIENIEVKETDFMNPPNEESTAVAVPTAKVFTIEEVEETKKHTKKVISELSKAEKAFTQVSCEIAWLYENDRFKALEPNLSFEQFAEQHFGFKKTQAYGLLKLVERFGNRSENGNYIIDDKYKTYGHTKLINMVNLSDEQIDQNINPKMTVADIKKAVKKLTKIESLDSDSNIETDKPNVYDTEDDSTGETPIDVESKEIQTQPIVSYTSFEAFEEDSPNFFLLVQKAFNAKKGCKVTISYEW